MKKMQTIVIDKREQKDKRKTGQIKRLYLRERRKESRGGHIYIYIYI